MGQALLDNRPGLAPRLGTVIPFFAFACALEALPRSSPQIIKTRDSFPSDDAALKPLYLAIKNAGLWWRRRAAWARAD